MIDGRRTVVLVAGLVVLGACSGSGSAGAPATGSQQPSAPATDPRRPSAPEPACADPPCYGAAETTARLSSDVVVEVSGTAASGRVPGLYYVVGDEPGTSSVAVVRADGTPVTTLEIRGMDARNAEALAVGPCGDGSAAGCLYVGDIGDHVGRDDVVVHRVPEPDLTEPPTSPVDSDVLRYTYPDGPTDAEALLVDGQGRPLIISKAAFDRDSGETGPTRLYRGETGGGTLEAVGTVRLPEPEDGLLAGFVGNVVTGASAADGRVLLRTYDEVLEFRAGAADADVAGFPGWPVRRVPDGGLVQAESVAYRADGCGYLTTSELTGDVARVGCTSAP
ncbi:hypothetical protein CLV30_104182 [Haloactinopolyspora alba]|uniref:Uncharacterized protein n=1 Tax=Haloactinopolyspora alba TaxID=648780 RepID=A0A2P8E782_9ACTN|nr:hypothetical protein [Haloactinopolyspora alba]PSL05316.1 hypothetical protein CLV30_104182 [Haloactinopolyspora alba]